MSKFFSSTRYLILIPIIGLVLAAAAFFVIGGFNLVVLLGQVIGEFLGLTTVQTHAEEIPLVIEVVEYVHQFLIGTVLYITGVGFYQLFIGKIDFPDWLKVDSTEELETALIGVTVVVLAVNFLAQVFVGAGEDVLAKGAGIALPIAALGIFVGMRAWAERQDREARHPTSVVTSEESDDET